MRWWAISFLLYAASSASAQPEPAPSLTDCDAIMVELKMRPPAYGNRARVNYIWNNYLSNCDMMPWSGQLDAGDVTEITKMINPQTFK